LTPTNYWATFLFMDPHNYGGVPLTNGEDVENLEVC